MSGEGPSPQILGTGQQRENPCTPGEEGKGKGTSGSSLTTPRRAPSGMQPGHPSVDALMPMSESRIPICSWSSLWATGGSDFLAPPHTRSETPGFQSRRLLLFSRLLPWVPPAAPRAKQTCRLPCPRAATTPQVSTRWRSRPGARPRPDSPPQARAGGGQRGPQRWARRQSHRLTQIQAYRRAQAPE